MKAAPPLTSRLQTRTSPSHHKFAPFLAVVGEENPSKFSSKDERIFTSLDPIRLLNDYARAGVCSTRNTKTLHGYFVKRAGLPSNIVLANSLLQCYCKSSAMVDALKWFGSIALPNITSWNIMISGYNQNLLFMHSWEIYCKMHSLCYEPDEVTYGGVVSACSALKAPLLSGQVFSLVMRKGFFSNGFIRAKMVNFYEKNCSLEEALRVFDYFSCRNLVSWNAIISKAVGNGENLVALDLFGEMCDRLVVPNSFTFSSVLTACGAFGDIEAGKGVHGWLIKCDAEDIYVETALVDLYAKCGDMDEAVKKFSRMRIRNVVSWTAVISGFVKKDDSVSALKFFREMRRMGEEINNYTLTSVIAACGKPTMFEEAIQIHSLIFRTGFCLDSSVGGALINMYSKVGAGHLSQMVFGGMENMKNLGTWASMVSSLAQNQNSGGAFELFQRMLQENLRPDNFCTSSVLSIIGCLNLGRQIHCYTLKTRLDSDVNVGCSLLTMYSKNGSLDDSYKVFQEAPEKDNVFWTSMLSGFAGQGFGDQALQLFREMLSHGIVPDQRVFNAILNACSAIHSLNIGKEIHGYAHRLGLENETVVGNALINMYSKCSSLKSARMVFDMLPQKDEFACSSLVSGYAQNGYIKEALLLFHDMLISDMGFDSFTLSSILGVIALLNRPSIGTQMHARIAKLGLDSHVSIGSSLVTMYSKFGSIEDCSKAFNQIAEPDLICWTTMIMSYAHHGKGAEAFRVYKHMRKEGIKPDSVTVVGVLSACSHIGLVEEAYSHLHSMAENYGIEPGCHHYACMVDLLARSGRLKEAERFINSMPIEPDSLIWGTLLSACKVHGNFELGKLAAKKVMELEPSNAGAYVSLSNICADVGWWDEVLKIRSQMNGIGVKKEPGWSFL
ncbi:Tetratricopeptide-like helical domain containing protein [Trema orientale]|uniref:Tetratricopeptide-like helical domain containing protein n=1 Tax=Trema orientale TaxID=63057 RepID=A0A2P5F731_TREOI|nr:Tetratricopeptide-like helical domain containing protein [Trema orientale]